MDAASEGSIPELGDCSESVSGEGEPEVEEEVADQAQDDKMEGRIGEKSDTEGEDKQADDLEPEEDIKAKQEEAQANAEESSAHAEEASASKDEPDTEEFEEAKKILLKEDESTGSSLSKRYVGTRGELSIQNEDDEASVATRAKSESRDEQTLDVPDPVDPEVVKVEESQSIAESVQSANETESAVTDNDTEKKDASFVEESSEEQQPAPRRTRREPAKRNQPVVVVVDSPAKRRQTRANTTKPKANLSKTEFVAPETTETDAIKSVFDNLRNAASENETIRGLKSVMTDFIKVTGALSCKFRDALDIDPTMGGTFSLRALTQEQPRRPPSATPRPSKPSTVTERFQKLGDQLKTRNSFKAVKEVFHNIIEVVAREFVVLSEKQAQLSETKKEVKKEVETTATDAAADTAADAAAEAEYLYYYSDDRGTTAEPTKKNEKTEKSNLKTEKETTNDSYESQESSATSDDSDEEFDAAPSRIRGGRGAVPKARAKPKR